MGVAAGHASIGSRGLRGGGEAERVGREWVGGWVAAAGIEEGGWVG